MGVTFMERFSTEIKRHFGLNWGVCIIDIAMGIYKDRHAFLRSIYSIKVISIAKPCNGPFMLEIGIRRD